MRFFFFSNSNFMKTKETDVDPVNVKHTSIVNTSSRQSKNKEMLATLLLFGIVTLQITISTKFIKIQHR